MPTPRTCSAFLSFAALLLTSMASGWLLSACAAPEADPYNVLIISVDSLRADRLRLWNPDDGVATPHLESLAERGTTFRNAWSTSPWTAPSMVSVFTGLSPPSHGVVYRDDTTPHGLATLPGMLEDLGYKLGNFSFFSRISYFRNLRLGPGDPSLRHGTVASGFREWLYAGHGDQAFFAWLHLLEPHLPYGASGYRATQVQVVGSPGLEQAQLRAALPVGSTSFAAGDRQRLLALYDQDVAEMDRVLGEILLVLDERDLTDQTLVVLVADHGEELLEDGWIGHASTAISAKMIPQILHIPMILAGPEIPAGVVSDSLVQQSDILPTLSKILGIEPPAILDGVALQPRWPWQSWPRGRQRAFFDSSTGGNLTPPERRRERLQAVTDGLCILTLHSAPGRRDLESTTATTLGVPAVDACSDDQRQRLRQDLERWRRQQAEQRLAILLDASGGAGPSPDTALADGFLPVLPVTAPDDRAVLRRSETSGQIILEWRGEGKAYWVQYRLGDGLGEVSGSFPMEQQRVTFGPFPEGFWNELSTYNPFRFRVLDVEHQQRSNWLSFTLEPTS